MIPLQVFSGLFIIPFIIPLSVRGLKGEGMSLKSNNNKLTTYLKELSSFASESHAV
jgi:hypothetical protein